MEMIFQANGGSFEVAKIHSMQPMPGGCFVVEFLDGNEETKKITAINQVLFAAILEFKNQPSLYQCYGVQDSHYKTMLWKLGSEIKIYYYGLYLDTCNLVGSSPRDFRSWFHNLNDQKTEFHFSV